MRDNISIFYIGIRLSPGRNANGKEIWPTQNANVLSRNKINARHFRSKKKSKIKSQKNAHCLLLPPQNYF
jgi:hypothetical protein